MSDHITPVRESPGAAAGANPSDLDPVVFASCNGHDETGGGLVAIHDGALEQLDQLSSSGLYVDEESAGDGKRGSRLFRLLHGNAYAGGAAELLVYDERGVRQYLRLDGAGEAHDVFAHADGFSVVSSLANGIIRFSSAGEIVDRWTAPGGPDSWHVNCVAIVDDRLYATAFGKFRDYREWRQNGARQGILFDVERGDVIIDDLSFPHDPFLIDDHWLVCNSGTRELLEFTRAGRRVRSLELPGWTRGLAATDAHLFVGVSSARRMPTATGTGAVVVLERETWAEVERYELPYAEVYGIEVGTRPLLRGVRRGFRTNPERVHESDQHALFRAAGVQPHRLWLTGLPLAPEAMRVQFDEVALPEQPAANALMRVKFRLANLGSEFLTSVPPNPVYIDHRWVAVDAPGFDGQRTSVQTRLPEPLAPGESQMIECNIATPSVAGTYRLTLTLVQTGGPHFDQVDPASGYHDTVEITDSENADNENADNIASA